jgi:hypothetical protein
MKMLRMSMVLVLAAFAVVANAQTAIMPPEDGIWSDPSQSGSGFVIETNNRIMAVAAFSYDGQRRSSWFLGTAPFDYSGRRWRANVNLFTGGQCLGCSYSAPALISGGADVEIRFTTQTSAEVFVDGVKAYSILRSYFDRANIDNFVLGSWIFSYQPDISSGNLLGDAIFLDRETSDAQGPYVIGFRVADNRNVVGYRTNSNPQYAILVDTTTEFNALYVMNPLKNSGSS